MVAPKVLSLLSWLASRLTFPHLQEHTYRNENLIVSLPSLCLQGFSTALERTFQIPRLPHEALLQPGLNQLLLSSPPAHPFQVDNWGSLIMFFPESTPFKIWCLLSRHYPFSCFLPVTPTHPLVCSRCPIPTS